MEPEIPADRFEVFANGLDHPECCAFDREANLWAGGEAGQLYRIDAGGAWEQVANLGGFCGGLAFSPSGELFVCVAGAGVVRVAPDGSFFVFADSADGKRIVAPNFPVFGRAGDLYVSDSGDWMGRNGRLLRFSPEGAGIEILAGLGYANGLALSADEECLFLAESDSHSVYRIALTGGSNMVETYASGLAHVPDGLSLDEEGNLYVTAYGSHCIYRVGVDRTVHLLARDPNGMLLGGPTNLCFGGPQFSDIYVANLCRQTITWAPAGRRGLRPANLSS